MNIHVNDVFRECLEVYSSESEDKTPFYLPKWIPLKNYSHIQSLGDICLRPWKYQSASEIDTQSHDAFKERYDGGGYVADLGYNSESASKVVRELQENNWVDKRTAVVFIESTLFDPSTSLFCNIRNSYEKLPTGQAVTILDVRVLSLYPSQNVNFQSFYEVCQLLFLIVIVVFFIVEIIKCFRQKGYFRQFWNWLELLLLVVSLAVVVVSFLKGKYTSLYVKKIQKNPYNTFSSDHIIYLLDVETFLLSAAIFIITLKLLKLIRFNRHICQMYGTLKSSAQPIMSFSLLFVVAVVAFTHFGYLCFGAQMANFSSFYKSLRLVLLMSVGKSINNAELHQKRTFLGPLYLFLFLMVMLFILINIFVALLVDAYGEIREEKEHGSLADAELGIFMYNVFIKKLKDFLSKIAGKTFARTTSLKLSDKEEGILLEISRPEDGIGIPLATPECSIVESASDKEDEILANDKTVWLASAQCSISEIYDEEDDILAGIKTSVIELSSELKTVCHQFEEIPV